ncbi:MAG TPA: hypothetical protein VG937_22835 [Polyangiaceae bacterium]|nr:hypothetical protein [Polyangiaceae bacterium]
MRRFRAGNGRVVGSLWMMAWGLGGACGCGVDSGGIGSERTPTPVTPSAGVSGLRVGASVDVRRAASAEALRFHGGKTQVAAAGLRHRFEIRDGVVHVQRLPAPVERRRELLARVKPSALFAPRSSTAPALELETQSISRAGYECIERAVPTAIRDDGGAQRVFSSCAERWTNRAQNGEVAFDFPQRPTGRGDLIVALRAQIGAPGSAMVVDSDEQGLRLATASGERFRFGHATWIDAAGQRTVVPARFRGGQITLTVPAAVVDASRYPAVLDPIVGPDLGTDAPVLAPSSSGIEPEVASDGNDSLVVFSDFQRIRAVRVDANGAVLDADWLDLGEDGLYQFRPMVAFGGGRYLVVWWQDDGTNASIWGRLLNPDGTLIGASSFPISSAQGVDAAVAWNGQNFVVGWGGFGSAPGVRIALVGVDGTVVAGSERKVSPGDIAFEQRIAVGDTTTVVAWEQQQPDDFSHQTIGATRLAQDGTVLDPGGIPIDPSDTFQDQPSVGSDGEHFLVAWRRSGELSTIQGALVGEDGSTTAAFPISRSAADVSRPAVASDGSQFLVAWQAQSDIDGVIAGAAVSASGVVLGSADTQLAGVPARVGADPTGLSWNGSHYLLAYDGLRTQPDGFSVFGIDGSLVAPDLTISADALAFSQLPNHQYSPHTAWDGVDYVVTWTDTRDGSSFEQNTARAVRITSAGVVRDPAGIAVTPVGAYDHALASNGARRSIVAWPTTTGGGLLRSLAANGTLGPVRAIASGALASHPMIASDGAGFLATFARANASGTRTDLFGTFVALNGNPGALFPIRRGIDSAGSLTTVNDDYLVLFSQGGISQMVTVSSDGSVSAPTPAPETPFASVSAASSDRNALVTWVTSTGEVQARRFARGALRGAVLSITPSSDGFPPAIAFDGARYWVVWAADFENERPMIRSVEINGTLGAPVQLVDEGCESPQLASNGAQQLLLTCFRFSDHYRVSRITTRLIDTSDGASVAIVAATSLSSGG